MTFINLREFIEFLEKKDDLKRVEAEVSTQLEITEIQNRLLKEDGPAILFENIVSENGKSSMPVLVNLFGSVRRIAYALDTIPTKLHEIGKTLAYLRQPEPPEGWKEALGMIPLIKTILSMSPKNVKKAPCQEIILTGNQIDLKKIPIQTCWPNEPAPLITWPLIVTKAKESNKINDYNLGIYRMQVVDEKTTIMRWLKHRGGASHYNGYQKNERMPVAAVIGASPATILAAVTPVPETISEYQFAGFLGKKKIDLVDCKTIPLKVPAEAEIILEGYINPGETLPEGPYGDHTGYYNDVEEFPVFHITAITMRKDPIYLSTFTGRSPDEPSILGEALNEIFTPIIKQQFPEIVDFYLPPEGCSYRIAIVSIKKSYPGHAKRIMMGIWSFLKQFIYTKFIYVVDEDINCRDWKDVMWAVSTRMDPARDMTIITDTPIDYLDFASPHSGLGSKVGFDATNKIYPKTNREWGKKLEMDKKTKELVDKKWHLYGLNNTNPNL
ncbi:MAG: UbiD family decarboxylase [Pseudomonadota bacterium]